MQKQNDMRKTSGAKAIAFDNRKILMKYRMLQLMTLVGGTAAVLGLHLIFWH
jgi:hypothetical protein